MITLNKNDFSWPSEPDQSPLCHLFISSMRQLYWSENHLVRMLLKMKNSSSSENFRILLEGYLELAKGHNVKLEQVLELLDDEIVGKTCETMVAVSRELDGFIEYTNDGSSSRDAAIVLLAEKIVTFTIYSYESVIKMATILGKEDVIYILNELLEEEINSLDKIKQSTELILQKAHVE